jgi:hypothetical protein
MSELKAFADTDAGLVAGRALEKSVAVEEHAAEVKVATKSPKAEASIASDGSVVSHLLFGLGTLVFVLPMLIPGIPMGTLVVVYGGMFVAVTLAFVVWSIVARLRERSRH